VEAESPTPSPPDQHGDGRPRAARHRNIRPPSRPERPTARRWILSSAGHLEHVFYARPARAAPPIGETSPISIESLSNPVKTRWSAGTSPRSISDVHRSRLHTCGWPLTLPRSRSRLRSMVGSHYSRLVRVRCVESRRWSRHDRCSERFRSGTTRRRKEAELAGRSSALPPKDYLTVDHLEPVDADLPS
jgi:hypothetical protein